MKKILISIKPKWIAKILNGEKTLEIRKTAPKCELPCEVYIYCTKGNSYLLRSGNHFGLLRENLRYTCIDKKTAMNGKVVAKFTLKKITPIGKDMFGYCPFTSEILDGEWLGKGSCLTQNDLRRYLGDKMGYAWHIDQKSLVIFDKPKELKEFKHWVSYRSSGKCPYVESEITPLCKTCREKVPLTNAPQSYMFCEVDE